MRFVVLAACAGDPGPVPPTSTPVPEVTGTFPERPAPGEPPPTGGEIACNGVDDDGDGLPASDAVCTPVPDEVLASSGENWPYFRIAPDLDGDGRDDVVAAYGNTPRYVELILSTDLSVAALGFREEGTENSSTPPWVGELDGAPGTDVWIAESLYHDPLGTDVDRDGKISPFDLNFISMGDLDGDGVDDLVGRQGGNILEPLVHSVAYGPFAGVVDDLFDAVAPGSLDVAVAPDLDGDGRAELRVALADGQVEFLAADGLAVVTATPPMAPEWGGDFDGDGSADLLIRWTPDLEAQRACDNQVLFGPFSGALDFEAVSWLTAPVVCEGAFPVGDVDGDGGTDFGWLDAGTARLVAAARMPATSEGLADVAVLSSPIEATGGYGGVTWGDLDGEPGLDVLIDSYNVAGFVYLNVGF